MTEKELQILGFRREDIEGTRCSDILGNNWTEDESYYYVYDLALGFSLISSEFDEERLYVDIFNTKPTIRFDDIKELKRFIKLIEKNTMVDGK